MGKTQESFEEVSWKDSRPGQSPYCSRGSGLRPLLEADIPYVVDIHIRSLETMAGRRFLERAFYPTILDPASTGFGFVQVRRGEVVGLIVGALDTSAWFWTLVRQRGFECTLAAVRIWGGGLGKLRQILLLARYLLVRPSCEPKGEIFSLAVDESYQGRGLAIKLLGAFLDRCRSSGVSRCWTKTPKTNRAAQRLYTHMGFRLKRELTVRDNSRFVYSLDFEAPGCPKKTSRSGKALTSCPGRLRARDADRPSM